MGLTACAFLGSTCCGDQEAACPVCVNKPKTGYEGYKLVWADEFEKDGAPDPTFWSIGIGGVINKELQDYRKDNLRCARVEGGKLILEAFVDPHDGVVGWGSNKPYHFEFSSGEVQTNKKVTFQYGRVDVSAKIPTGKGVWPAIWLMPVKTMHGKYSEIDVMEHVQSLGQSIQATVHTQETTDKKQGFSPVKAGYAKSNTLDSEYHLYSLIWTENKLEVLFDNKVFFTYEKPKDATWDNWSFDQPFYLIMNVAVGGSWGGKVDQSIFPKRMEVDYVRYYQKVKES